MSPYEAALRAQIVSLCAREAALRQFVLNREAQFEANVVAKQIEALRAELKRVMP